MARMYSIFLMNVPDAACVEVEANQLHEVGAVLIAQRVYVEKPLVIAALQAVHCVRDVAGFGVIHLLVGTGKWKGLTHRVYQVPTFIVHVR